MKEEIHATNAIGRFRILHRKSVDSTNRFAVDAARAGESEGLVVVADHQTKGRGRRGRSWVAPTGSGLLCSIVFRPNVAHDELHLISSLVALSALDAISEECEVAAAIKWPNDLVVREKKLGGILAELVEDEAGGRALVVGIGVNLVWGDEDLSEIAAYDRGLGLPFATTLAFESGVEVDRDVLLSKFLHCLEDRYSSLIFGGFPSHRASRTLMAEYSANLSTLSRDVRVELVDGEIIGRAIAVDASGRLIVAHNAERFAIEVGDVIHLRSFDDA